MSELSELFSPHSATGILTVVFAGVLVLELAESAPFVLLGLAVVLFCAWLVVRSGVLYEDDDSGETSTDPLSQLQTRYANGELTEAEFERRVDRILESDARAREKELVEERA